MQIIVDFLKSDISVIIMAVIIVILLLLYIFNNIKLNKIKNNQKKFLSKLGYGENIEENLKLYIDKVEELNNDNKRLEDLIKQTNYSMAKCIQKVGIVRYSAFKDVGSDLSFTLALLDEKNDGVVLNGIYSSDMSNIYAKPVKNGESSYTLSEQEKEAIKKAVNIES